MMIEQPPPPNLHTTYLSKSQLKTCNKNPTYRTRLSELQALHSELQRILNILTERTTGKLPSPKPSLRKRLSLNRGQTTALKLQLQLSDREDDAFVQRVRAEYLAQEKRLCEWDDQCAALAESLLSKPRFQIGDGVVFVDGRWVWPLPSGSMVIPRHFPQGQRFSCESQQSQPETAFSAAACTPLEYRGCTRDPSGRGSENLYTVRNERLRE